MQKFVEHILQPYKHQQVEQMGMDKDSKFIWFLDCQRVHHLGERNESQILFISSQQTSLMYNQRVHDIAQTFQTWF
jgi:hypothetical protein